MAGFVGFITLVTAFADNRTLNGIKSKTVGDGQHGTARWATDKKIKTTYAHVPFQVKEWRKGSHRPKEQGLMLGSTGKKGSVTALVDNDDIHCLMIGASGVGKTAFFLYPNLECACASGMSFLALDTKGDLARNYGTIAKKYGKEGCEIIQDNCQGTIFGGFAPNSQTAEVLSKALGSCTLLSGSVTRGKDSNSQSLQMAERPLMSPDKLRSIPKGQFIVMKTGSHPMKTRLRLFLDWDITFEDAYTVPERADRRVRYAGCEELERSITGKRNACSLNDEGEEPPTPSVGGMGQVQQVEKPDPLSHVKS